MIQEEYNMKVQNAKWLSLGLALTLALSLTACGGDKNEEADETLGPVADRVEAVTGQNDGQEAADESITLSDWLGGGEAVWYLTETPVDQLGKDTEVETLLLLEPDGTAYAGSAGGMTLGELAQMNEADLAQEARDAYAVAAKPDILRNFADASDMDRVMMLNELLEFSLPGYAQGDLSAQEILTNLSLPETLHEPLQRYLDTLRAASEETAAFADLVVMLCDGYNGPVSEALAVSPEEADALTAAEEQLFAVQDEIADILSAEPQPGRWALGLNTDQTGNSAESVTFAWCVYRPESTKISSATCYASSGEGQTVYDVLYGGVDLEGSGALVTRVDGAYAVVLEDTDSGLPLDAEPEALFS